MHLKRERMAEYRPKRLETELRVVRVVGEEDWVFGSNAEYMAEMRRAVEVGLHSLGAVSQVENQFELVVGMTKIMAYTYKGLDFRLFQNLKLDEDVIVSQTFKNEY